MADLPVFEESELQDTARNLLRTRRRGIDVTRGSDWDLWALLLGSTAWLMLEQTKIASRLLIKSAAWGDYLRQYAYEAGIGRDVAQVGTVAQKARGRVILRSTTGSQTQLAGSVLKHADGTTYTLDADVTTAATATKVLRAGLHSGRRRLFQGHVGGGFVAAAAGEVYRFAPTGEYCALRDVDNGMALKRWLFDLYNELDADPALQDLFAQQLGAVGAITAEQSGAVGNKDAKDVLTLVSPAGTVLAEAIILYTAGGADAMAPAETQQALRSLLSARDDLESIADLRALALDFPGAALRECYLVPGATGIGTYTLLPVLADGQFCGPNLRAAFLAYMQARVTFDVLTTSAVYEAVDSSIATLAVQVSGIYAPDWVLPGESNEGFVVNASTTQTLTLDNVTGIRIGSRVLVASNGSSGPYVVQRTVTSIASFSVTLDEALPFPVDLGGPITSRVTPGGPLGNAIVDAIYAAYEARAPSVADTGAAARYPSPIVPDSVSGILAAVSSVEGVADVDYVGGSPPALATPGGVLVPGMVILMSTERL